MRHLRWFFLLGLMTSSAIAQNAPSATTEPATSVTPTSAVLNGSVVPKSTATTVYFEWGTTTNLGQVTPATELPSGNTAVPVNFNVSALSEGTTHFFRAVCSNRFGMAFGSTLSFTTEQQADVTTLPASDIGGQSATLHGSFAPNGPLTAAYFEWGTTTNYGNTTAQTVVGGTGGTAQFLISLSGLDFGQTYHYRAVASNQWGVVYGDDLTFQTAVLPEVVTMTATNITIDLASLTALLSNHGHDTFVYFDWGTTTNFGQTTAPQAIAGSSNEVEIVASIGNLLSGATYYFRAVASNNIGVAVGAVQSFATEMPPDASTSLPTDISGAGATLNGNIAPRGNETAAYFEWGTSISLGNVTAAQIIPYSK